MGILKRLIFGRTGDSNYIPEQWRYISATKFFFIYWIVFIPLLMVLTLGIFMISLVGAMWFVETFFESDLTFNWWLVSLGLLGLSIYVNLPNTLASCLVVPNQHVAVLTVFGQRTAWFLNEGNYPNFTTGTFLGRSHEVVDDFTTNETSPNGPGFIKMGRLSFQLWNNMKDKTPLLSNVARNGAQVKTTVLIVLKVRNPNLVLSAEEPSKEVFERARTAIRSGNSFFTDKDNAFVKTILVKLMMGKTIITAFINTDEPTNYENGSIIRDYGGKAMVMEIDDSELLDDNGDQLVGDARVAKLETFKVAFRKELADNADIKMLEYVPSHEGKRVVYDKSVDQSLEEVTHPNGIEVESASVSNVQFSDEVSKAANSAASEFYQSKIMRDSAIAQTKAEAALREGRNGHEPSDLDKVLVGAQDNDKIKIVHVSGTGSDLTKAASLIDRERD